MDLRTEFHRIASDAPPYLIAEIGLNHNGDVSLAERMVDAAREAGAHAAKFQMFQSELLLDAEATLGDGPPGSLRTFFRQFELSGSDWKRLSGYTRARGIDFACSVFDTESLAQYAALNPAYVKIASGDVDNRLLLEAAASQLPVIFSTGTADAQEVDRAVGWVQNCCGGRPFAVLQCVSLYPALPEEYNLSVIPAWIAKYDCPVGVSDHCSGNAVSIGAVAFGACIIERHFTLDRGLPGPDQGMSLEPGELRALAGAASAVFEARGDGRKRCLDREAPVRRGARRSLHTARPVTGGHIFVADDVRALRPSGGISPADAAALVGKTAARDLPEGHRLGRGDVMEAEETLGR